MISNEELVKLARDLADLRYVPHTHSMFSALVTKSGQTFVGAHIEAGNGRVTICAEGIAIGAAATGGDTNIDTIVAVTESGDVVPPCGICRELISDYAPDAMVLLHSDSLIRSVPISKLLPTKYNSSDYPNRRETNSHQASQDN